MGMEESVGSYQEISSAPTPTPPPTPQQILHCSLQQRRSIVNIPKSSGNLQQTEELLCEEPFADVIGESLTIIKDCCRTSVGKFTNGFMDCN